MAIPHIKHEFFKTGGTAVAKRILCLFRAASICASLTQVRPLSTTRVGVRVCVCLRAYDVSRCVAAVEHPEKMHSTFRVRAGPSGSGATSSGRKREECDLEDWLSNRHDWNISVWECNNAN